MLKEINMKKKVRALDVAAVLFLIGAFFVIYTILNINSANRSGLVVSEVMDSTGIESILSQYNLEVSDANDIRYYILDDTKVLIIDDRNAEQKLYTHSEITAELDDDGTLKVVVKDEFAVSEADISGKYAVIIDSENRIVKVEIEKKE